MSYQGQIMCSYILCYLTWWSARCNSRHQKKSQELDESLKEFFMVQDVLQCLFILKFSFIKHENITGRLRHILRKWKIPFSQRGSAVKNIVSDTLSRVETTRRKVFGTIADSELECEQVIFTVHIIVLLNRLRDLPPPHPNIPVIKYVNNMRGSETDNYL